MAAQGSLAVPDLLGLFPTPFPGPSLASQNPRALIADMDSDDLILWNYSDLISGLHKVPGLDLQEMKIKWDLDVKQATLSC